MKKTVLFIVSIFTFFGVYSQCPNPEIVWWQPQNDRIIVDGVNDATIDYFQFAYKANTSFEPGDGTETLFTFDEFPTQVTGLTPNTLYFFAVRSVCVDGTVNPWQDNNMDGPDAWQTINCPVIYNLPFNLSFDALYGASCHKFVDLDDDLYYWYWFDYGFDNGEGNVASSYSWAQDDGPLTPDNWMILGPINLNNVDQATLGWKVRGLNSQYCQENYSVYVSDSDNISDILSDSLSYTETIESGGDACNVFSERSIDISEMTGNEVYVSFRHHDVTDMLHLNIDDIYVQQGLGLDNQVLPELNYTFYTPTQLLSVQSANYDIKELQIFDAQGKAIAATNENGKYAELSFQKYSTGLYFVVVITEKGLTTIKVLNP